MLCRDVILQTNICRFRTFDSGFPVHTKSLYEYLQPTSSRLGSENNIAIMSLMFGGPFSVWQPTAMESSSSWQPLVRRPKQRWDEGGSSSNGGSSDDSEKVGTSAVLPAYSRRLTIISTEHRPLRPGSPLAESQPELRERACFAVWW